MSTRHRAAMAVGCALVFLGCCVLLHLRGAGFGDTPVYHNDAVLVEEGQMPYRDFPVEYPPGFLLPAVGPEATATVDAQSYVHEFGVWMTGAGVLLVLCAAVALSALRVDREHYVGALGFIAVSPLVLGNLTVTHFDLWVTVLAFAGLSAMLAGRDRTSGVLLGAAIATKIWPAILVPLGLVWILRRRDRAAAVRWLALVVAVCAAFFLPFAALAPSGLGRSFGLLINRPLQLESLGSTILLAAHNLAGFAVSTKAGYGSINLLAPGTAAMAYGTTLLELAALCAVWVAFARGPVRADRLATAAAASIATFIAFGKVFSPQYVIWLIPFVPLVRSRLASLLLAVILVGTQFYFPAHYSGLLDLRPWVTWLLLARNLVVAMLAVTLGRLLLERVPMEEIAAEPARAAPMAEALPALQP
jgi:glycosyl transferase family 87